MADETSETAMLSKRIADLEAENDALRQEADELDRRVAELEDEIEGRSEEQHHDEHYVAGLESEIDVLTDANADLEARLESAEGHASSSDPGLGSDEERVYLASKNRRHFHRPQCRWAGYIPNYLLLEFGSHLEAVQAGYKPCKTCQA